MYVVCMRAYWHGIGMSTRGLYAWYVVPWGAGMEERCLTMGLPPTRP